MIPATIGTEKKEQTLEKVLMMISLLLRFSLVIAGMVGIFSNRLDVMFFSLLTLFLSFFPAIIERNYHIRLPVEFEAAFVIFIYSSIFLGEIYDYYYRFWWWDIALHSLSSILTGLIGFTMMYVLYSKQLIKANRLLVALFAFSFAVALGALWEIFEYGMDTFFGLNMLKEGLSDTMEDLIVNCLGAFLVSLSGYMYLKSQEGPIVEGFIKKLLHKNPKLFKRGGFDGEKV